MSSHTFPYSFSGNGRTWTLRPGGKNQKNASVDPIQGDNRVSVAQDEHFDSSMKKWPAKQLMRLLRLYRAHSCLWDTRDADNRSRKLRKAALIDITEAMGGGATCAQISQKIQVLRATYRHEKLCIKQRISKGIGAKTKLKWFALAHSFLRDVYRSDYNKEGAAIHSPLEHDIVQTIDPETDDEYLQSKDMYIKSEPNEDVKSVSSLNSSINCPTSIIKAEENSIEAEENHQQMNTTKREGDSHDAISNENDTINPSALDTVLPQHITQTPAAPNNEDSNSLSNSFFVEPQSCNMSPTKHNIDGYEDNPLEGKWSLRHSVKFLRLYGGHRCLWDLTNPNYRSREMRNAALEDIAAAMGYGLNTDYVAKKIKIFRITYMQHRKRMIEDIKENREPDVKLRWFPLADSFLRPHIGLRSIKNQEREVPQFDYQYVYTNLNLIDPDLLTDFTKDCSKKNY